MQSENKAGSLKEKAIEELKAYWIIFAFLALMFSAFTAYRRLILTEFSISYFHYGAGVVEAAVIAKVILIGQALGLGRRLEEGPLITAALFKAVVYGGFVGLFAFLEHVIEGLLHGKDWEDILHGLLSIGLDEILARTLMVIVTFIPFFAFWETNRVLGEGKLLALFFRKRTP